MKKVLIAVAALAMIAAAQATAKAEAVATCATVLQNVRDVKVSEVSKTSAEVTQTRVGTIVKVGGNTCLVSKNDPTLILTDAELKELQAYLSRM
jgi:outer membrane lipoprotein-sorting protein